MERLGSHYAEEAVGVGVTQQGALVEVLASDGGTWSIVISTPDGLSCLVAAGDGWRSIEPTGIEDPLASLPPDLESGT